MINDFIVGLFNVIDMIVNSTLVLSTLSSLLNHLNVFSQYTADIQYYLSGAYFFFGKSYIMFVLYAGTTVFSIKLIMSIVMIIAQFIP